MIFYYLSRFDGGSAMVEVHFLHKKLTTQKYKETTEYTALKGRGTRSTWLAHQLCRGVEPRLPDPCSLHGKNVLKIIIIKYSQKFES